MVDEAGVPQVFAGFADFRANVTFVPIQFFTAVLPHRSRGTARIVGYALRQLLGWVDDEGNPTRERLQLTYRELIEQAGVSREAISGALDEAIQRRLLRCVGEPQPATGGKAARHGIYELVWDTEGDYTDDPASFRGFYYPEAVIVEEREGGATVRRPKAARKNIPNAFFDHLLPRERLSVIRVVGALLFYSIQWGPGGERKVPVSRSITELSRLTHFSRQHVHEAVMEARQRGYIEQVDGGCFDPAAAKESRPATYGIRWVSGSLAAQDLNVTVESEGAHLVSPQAPAADRSEKVYGAAVRNGVRDRSEKVNGERSKKVNDISIKKELKTDLTTAAAAPEPASAAAVAAVSGYELLRQTGFDEPTARRLADGRSRDVIVRQVEWLSLRRASSNRLGLLRRAIEQDWPKPEGMVEDHEQKLGRMFASHYYAAYHGYPGEAATEPFPKDVQAAAQFVARLPAQDSHELRVREWGRQFGGLMRQRHRGDARARPNLSLALVLQGDEFLRRVETEHSARARKAGEKSHEARHAARRTEYLAYLQLVESDAQRTAPGLYAGFLAERARTRQAMTGGLFQASAETLAKFDREESRLLALAEFFRDHAPTPVLDFEQWDRHTDPLPRDAAPTTGERLSVRLSPSAATERG